MFNFSGERRPLTAYERALNAEECVDNRRFAVLAFWRRKDNQGNERIFRKVDWFRSLQKAEAFFRKPRSASHLYVVLIRMSDMEAIRETGDASVEEEWVDTPTAPVSSVGFVND